MIFVGADPEQSWHWKAVFISFLIISGLKINLGKSELVQIGDALNVEALAGILSCKLAQLPMTYLGLSLGSTFKAKAVWNGMIEKMERQLAGWKMMYLSKGIELYILRALCPVSLLIFYPCS